MNINKLKLIENELVPVYKTSTGEQVVDGRELWTVLGSKRKFADWIKDRFYDCDAVENQDYFTFHKNVKRKDGQRGSTVSTEYIIQLDTAKEMAMLERNDVGKKVRRYFIEVEKRYKEKQTQEWQIARALKEIA